MNSFFFFNGKENASKMFIKNMAAFQSEAGGRRESQERPEIRAETSRDCLHVDLMEGEIPACSAHLKITLTDTPRTLLVEPFILIFHSRTEFQDRFM